MQREAEVRAGKLVGLGLSTTFTLMSDWIIHSAPTEADGDMDGDVLVQVRPESEVGTYLHWAYVSPWTPWRHTAFRKRSTEAPQPEPEPEPVDAEFTPPAAEIPEPIRTGAAPFYVLVLSDDNPRGPGGEPIVWEHSLSRETTLQAALKRRDSIGSRYGTTHIAECRIIPELTREVPADV